MITGLNEDFVASRDLTDSFIAWQVIDQGTLPYSPRKVATAFRERSGVVKGPNGEAYAPRKRSISGYVGIKINQQALDGIAAHDSQKRNGRFATPLEV